MIKFWVLSVVIVAILAGGWLSYNAKGGPVIPFDALTHGIMALIALYVYTKIKEAYAKSGNIAHRYLTYFMIGWIIAGFSVAMGNFYFFDMPQLFGLGFIIAIIALFSASAYLVRIPFVLKNAPGLEKLVFRLVLAVGALIILFNIIYWPMSYVNEAGFTVYNSGYPVPFFGLLAFTAYGAVAALLSLFFLYGFFATKESVARMRSLFFALGTLLSVGLGLHLTGAGALSSWGELSVAVGFLFVLMGVLYKDKE
jgi:hypothetical protein